MLPLAILWMNLVTDSLPIIALSVEKIEPDIMKKKPINNKKEILSNIWQFILISGITVFLISFLIFLTFYQQDIDKARTMVITSAIFSEMCVVLASRSRKNIWNTEFFSNKFVLGAIILAVSLQMIAIYSPLGNIFEFKPLGLLDLVLVIGSSFITLIVLESWKFYKNKKMEN